MMIKLFPSVISCIRNFIFYYINTLQGHPRLVNAIAKLYSKLINRDLDPNKEVLVTAGAYEALYATLQGHTNPGDEWIIIEPFFDCYVPMVQSAEGIPRYIALKPVNTLNNANKNFLYIIYI